MAFSRASQSELPESQVEYREPSTAKHWLTLILYIILAFAIAAVVVLAARWVYHKAHHINGANTISTTSQSSTQKTPVQSSPSSSASNSASSAPSVGSSTNKSGSTNSSGSGSQSSGSSPSNSSGNAQPKSGNTSMTPQTATLPNNGPGDVIALFALSSLGGAGLHYILRQRRRSYFRNY